MLSIGSRNVDIFFVYKHICLWLGYLKAAASIQWLTDLQCKNMVLWWIMRMSIQWQNCVTSII